MSIYNVDGAEIFSAYGLSGSPAVSAYDITGSMIFPTVIPEAKVMSFNVGCFYTQYFPAPASTGTVFYNRHKEIFGHYPGLLFAGLSEWHNTIGTVSTSVLMDEFFEAYAPAYDAYRVEGAALTSAYGATPSNVTFTPYSTQSSNLRYYQRAYLNFYGKTICCILTHLDLDDAIKYAQLSELLDVVENEEYFIISGDFNHKITQIGDDQYNASIKVILERGYNSAQNNEQIYMTWYDGTTAADSDRIWAVDNIITSPNIEITDVERDTTKLTDGLCEQYGIMIDHLPLVATLRIT